MERRDLRLVRVRTQTVVPVVLCQFAQCLINRIFNFREGRVLGCDTQIVCVDETPCSIMDGLMGWVQLVRSGFVVFMFVLIFSIYDLVLKIITARCLGSLVM